MHFDAHHHDASFIIMVRQLCFSIIVQQIEYFSLVCILQNGYLWTESRFTLKYVGAERRFTLKYVGAERRFTLKYIGAERRFMLKYVFGESGSRREL